ncbi:hypothetical protein J421_4659 (plasmid) [Gemmatirosa kalamazoonensis]|uniref:Uncharacterized protein n=1 Tax=Gemmatirosa kalamazoonensis TaxID=861299 RepID=W0RMX3_9BACT|nr:phage tail tube protein [Gemmatirosa kalamazoonensis]AHG92126.1 hypothetical protein J421_4591 [Gemmatirosa kalamazoonensis]AHG92194.1 hypothetical protein J421_4659 [Gemmatirosa kalamazoonensis]
MGQATRNRIALKVARQSVSGTVPAAALFNLLRYTDESLGAAPQVTPSGEIVSDRNMSDPVLTGRTLSGGINGELSARSYDPLLESAMFASFTRTAEFIKGGGYAGLPEVTALSAPAANIQTATVASGGTFVKSKMLVQVSGFANATNNGVFLANADGGATTVTWTNAAGVAEAAPPAGARIKVIGAELPTTTQSGASNLNTATGVNFASFIPADGAWVWVGGDAANKKFATNPGGWARVAKAGRGNASLTFDILPIGWAADTNAAANSIRIYFGDFIANGVTPVLLAFERSFLDINNVHELFSDGVMGAVSYDLSAKSIAKVSYSGLTFATYALNVAEQKATTSTLGLGNTPYNTLANIGMIVEGGSAIPLAGPNYVLAAKINLDNGLRELPALATANGIIGVNPGKCNVTGSITAYLGDSTLLAKVMGQTPTNLAFPMREPNTDHGTVLDLPAVKYTTGAPAGDQDITVELGFQAYKHASLGYAFSQSILEGIGL